MEYWSTYFDPPIYSQPSFDIDSVPCFCGERFDHIGFKSESRHLIGCTFLQKRITMLPWWLFHNKFLIRDTIKICSNATNYANFTNFWSPKHNPERICHGSSHSRGLTHIEGKIFDTTNRTIWPRCVGFEKIDFPYTYIM